MYSMQSIEEYRGQKSAHTTDTTITVACRSGRLTAIRSNQLFKSSM